MIGLTTARCRHPRRTTLAQVSLVVFDDREDRVRRQGPLGGIIRMDLEMVLMNAPLAAGCSPTLPLGGLLLWRDRDLPGHLPAGCDAALIMAR